MSSDRVRYRRSPHVHEEPLEGELALLHLERAEIRSLNEVASILWDALGEHELYGSVGALASLLAEARPGTSIEDHRPDVERFLEQLEQAGLVERLVCEDADGAPK